MTILQHESHRSAALMSFVQLHWFIRLRWLIVLFGLGLLLLEYFTRPVQHPEHLGSLPYLLGVIVAVALVNIIWMFWSRLWFHHDDASQIQDPQLLHDYLIFANAQVAIDLLLLTVAIRFSGGVESPLIAFYLFHMVIGSLLLRAWQVVLQAFWTVALFALVVLGEYFGWLMPHYGLLAEINTSETYLNWRYIGASIVVVTAAVFGILYFTLHIAARLDIQEDQLRQANQELRQSELAIRELQRRRSRFMQTAAHQLKGPLAAIQTLTSLIRDQIVTGPAVEQTSRKIIKRCQDGIQQISELLTLARVQEADPRRQFSEPANLNRIINQLLERYLPLAGEKQIDLKLHFQPDAELWVQIHPADLMDSLGNLLDNAIKYTLGPGRVDILVDFQPPPSDWPLLKTIQSFAYHAETPHVWIGVRDTGIGLSGKDAGSLFDVFHRGERALAEGISGSGIGLSIIREVVEQTGGLIQVYSQIGQGTMFSMALKRCSPDSTHPLHHDHAATIDL